ncbi:MAG: glycerol kinase GlpK, partial [Lachnospiraceae bacterium]|nr:glycerol kinase GlpK [Lachnospiraceae bacterium]
NRCIIFDKHGNIVSMAQKEFTQGYPKPGWVEHDANEIWSTIRGVAAEAMSMANAEASDIAALGITNQRETVVVWDRLTGEPVCPAIVWQCRRSASRSDELKKNGMETMFRAKTGLTIDAYFSATKLEWILNNVKGVRERAQKGEVIFGTIETWLIFKLTKGKSHVTDYSNASRTMLFNIHTLEWDNDLLDVFGIPKAMLPKPVPSSGYFGECDPTIFGGAIMIGGAAGDQQAALFGQACFSPGDVKNTYGTGGFLLMNTGKTPIESKKGLLTTIGWGLNGEICYALEGSIFVAGAAIQWLRDEMGLISQASDSENAALSVEDTAGCYVVPAFTGLGTPYWDPYARGTIVGITRGVNKNHIIRAALDSIAYQVRDVIKAMEDEAGISLQDLRVDGGACANNYLMQMQADILNVRVKRPACIETTALGAAYLAGLSVGFWKDIYEISENWQIQKTFSPLMNEEKREELLAGWEKALARSFGWAK